MGEWLLPSPAMATTAMDTAMDMATATTSATAMDTTDTTARGRLSPSPAMATTAMDTATATATDTTSATAMDTTDTTARGPLMLSLRLRPPPLLSLATDTTAMDTVTVWDHGYGHGLYYGKRSA